MTPRTFTEADEDREDRRALVMEMLESARTPAEAWELLNSVGADIDDRDVMWHLGFNTHITWLDLERWETTRRAT